VRVFKDLQIFSIAFVYAEYIMYNLISSYAISTIRDNMLLAQVWLHMRCVFEW